MTEAETAEAEAADSETAEELSQESAQKDRVGEQSETAHGVPVTEVRSQQVLHPAKEEFAELAATLKAEGYGQCVDLCAVDYLTNPDRPGLPASIVPERFEVVAVFIFHGGADGPSNPSTPGNSSLSQNSASSSSNGPSKDSGYPGQSSPNGNAGTDEDGSGSTFPHRIRARVQVPEGDPVLPSITDIYPGTENMEREIYDMFGIAFRGNPDLTRILMPDEWKGHPLRRDYAVGQVPVQFKGAPS